MSPESLRLGWVPLVELLRDGVAQLAEQHWHEIAHDHAQVPLAIDWPALQRRELFGQWAVFAAYRGMHLVGYVSFYAFRPERYSTTLYINDDVFWLHPDERKGWTGYRLLKAAIEGLPRPCKLQFRHKLAYEGGRVGSLLERLGLKPVEVVYSRFLEK